MQVHWNLPRVKLHQSIRFADSLLGDQLVSLCNGNGVSQSLSTTKIGGKGECEKDNSTHEFAASLKPFSIAGMKPDGIACPTIMFSNSNFSLEPGGSGST